MTVQRVRRDSDVFRITCTTCGTHTNVRGDDQFQVGREANRIGWTTAGNVRCNRCPATVTKPRRK